MKIQNSKNLIDYDDNIDFDERSFSKWNLREKIESDDYSNENFVKSFDNAIGFGKFNLESDGFETPLLFRDKAGLKLKLPQTEFSVDNVADSVGRSRRLDVVDVDTQDAIAMSMKEWCEYFNNRDARTRLLNVISLEYSQTRMDRAVTAPAFVLESDWLERAWPRALRDTRVDNRSYQRPLQYPRVRKYCLMSVAGCFTDFHIDLGGTSVWYHIFRGEKVFWIIPPTKANLLIYEKWCVSNDQAANFFPDLVEKCQKVHLKQGNTFLIPSGWIHGVYTPCDSLVFGGNFLHSLSIPMQLRVWEIEEKIKVNEKYRYPYFIEMHWFVLAAFVCSTGGKCFLVSNDQSDCNHAKNLNQYEIEGLQIILQWLKKVSLEQGRSIPNEIDNPDQLLLDAEIIYNSFSNNKSSENHNQKIESRITNTYNSSDLMENINKTRLNSSNCPKKKIPVVRIKEERKVKKESHSKKRKLKFEISQSAEIPRDMFDKITQRTGSRQIVRPNRMIENPYK